MTLVNDIFVQDTEFDALKRRVETLEEQVKHLSDQVITLTMNLERHADSRYHEPIHYR